MKKIFLSNKSAVSKMKKLAILGVVIIFGVSAIIFGALVLNPNNVPSSTPSETDPTTAAPLETDPPTSNSLEVDLDEALAGDLVQATISGYSYFDVDITLEAIEDPPLIVTVPVGTIFESQSAGVQDIVVIEPCVFHLESSDSVYNFVYVASTSMSDDTLGYDDVLVVSNDPISTDLSALLNVPDFRDEPSLPVRQWAIWTVTDNPPRFGYDSIYHNGQGPTKEEMSRIRDLFESAGISTEKYQGLIPPLQVDLGEALARGLVQATISGAGLQSMDVTLESFGEELLDQLLEVTIPVGTFFGSQSSGVQDMVVIEPSVFDLEPIDSVSELVSVACADMELDAPDNDDDFVVSSESISSDLSALLDLPDFHDEAPRVKQFAIWTITDNPSRDGYVHLTYGDFGGDSGPDYTEMSRIRDLFEAAGISTEKYKALS